MLTHIRNSSFIFKGKILMKEERVLEYFAGRWHWISPASMSKCQYRNTLPQFCNWTFGILQDSDERQQFHQHMSFKVFPISASSAKLNILLWFRSQRILSWVCLKKWGKRNFFFFKQLQQYHLPAVQNRGNEMGAFMWGYFHGVSLITSYPLDLIFCQFLMC